MSAFLRAPAVRAIGITLVLLVATACDAAAPSPPPGSTVDHPGVLAGTFWRVETVGGAAPIAKSEPTLSFGDGKASGSGGCNQFSGAYRYDAASGRIAFDELAMTAMACLERPRNDFETRFMQALGAADLATAEAGNRLVLTGRGGRIVFVVAPMLEG